MKKKEFEKNEKIKRVVKEVNEERVRFRKEKKNCEKRWRR